MAVARRIGTLPLLAMLAFSPSQGRTAPYRAATATFTPRPLHGTATPVLTVKPSSGPVGQHVLLKGENCQDTPNQHNTQLYAYVSHRDSDAPFGSLTVSTEVRPQKFTASYKIPAVANELNGAGGGPIRTGDRIQFFTAPPVCASNVFEVVRPGSGAPTLTVKPSSGPIGQHVLLKGQNCQDTANQHNTQLFAYVFHRDSDGEFGSLTVSFEVRPQKFTASYRIPAIADELNGAGGGPIGPGDRIQFFTAPPVCASNVFEVLPVP